MKLVPLTRGLFAKVDDQDFDAVSKWKWHAFQGSRNKTFYAVRSERIGGRKVTIWMHRFINETPDGFVTDHRNGDGLDNQRGNLRSATHQENMVNNSRHVSRNPRGVSWHKSNKCWVAQITVNRKNIYIGRFQSSEEAARAYETKRAELRPGEIYRG